MEINFSTRFPVKFFDGKTESDEGTISINPSLTFKSFQSLISQQLKISPHQITIYFERNDENPNFHQNHHHRRHPVTRKFNFSSIMGDSDSSFFWVVKKRSRRSRRRNSRIINDFSSPGDVLPNFVLLRRNFEEFDYMKMLEEREREEYLMSLSLNSNVYYDLNHFYGYGGLRLSDDGASSSGNGSSIDVHRQCDICFHNAIYGGETTPFHFCTNDIVVSDFRSTAGPIAPPSKTA